MAGKGTAKAAQNRTALRAPVWEKAFLKSLGRYGVVTAACEAAQISRRTVYERRETNEVFKAAWDEALEIAADRLELEARRRAERGTLKPVYYKGARVGFMREYSNDLMALLLKAHKPEKYRERTDVTSNGETLAAPIIYLPKVDDGSAQD